MKSYKEWLTEVRQSEFRAHQQLGGTSKPLSSMSLSTYVDKLTDEKDYVGNIKSGTKGFSFKLIQNVNQSNRDLYDLMLNLLGNTNFKVYAIPDGVERNKFIDTVQAGSVTPLNARSNMFAIFKAGKEFLVVKG
jgi:hypothetical protein